MGYLFGLVLVGTRSAKRVSLEVRVCDGRFFSQADWENQWISYYYDLAGSAFLVHGYCRSARCFCSFLSSVRCCVAFLFVGLRLVGYFA